jgi:hypothetical protein
MEVAESAVDDSRGGLLVARGWDKDGDWGPSVVDEVADASTVLVLDASTSF